MRLLAPDTQYPIENVHAADRPGDTAEMRGRVAWCLLSLLAVSACSAWRNATFGRNAFETGANVDASFTPIHVPDHVLVVTTKGTPHALELEGAHVAGAAITGIVVRRWRVPDGSYEIDHLEDQDPDGVATVLGWELEPDAPREETSIATADIAYARAYDIDARRAIKTLTYACLGVAAIVIVIKIATLPPPPDDY